VSRSCANHIAADAAHVKEVKGYVIVVRFRLSAIERLVHPPLFDALVLREGLKLKVRDVICKYFTKIFSYQTLGELGVDFYGGVGTVTGGDKA